MTTTNHIDDAASARTKNATNTATSFVITGFGPFGGVKDNPTTVIVRRLDSYLRSPSNFSDESDETRDPNGDDGGGGDDHSASHISANGSVVADLVKEYVVFETSAHDVNETMDRIRKEHIEVAASAAATTTDSKDTDGTTTGRRILLLHLGVGRSTGFRLESCAYNEATFRIPDQKGYQPNEEPIVSDPCHEVGQCYETSLDLEGLQRQMKRDFPGVATAISTDPGRYVCNYVYCKSLEVSLPHSTRNQSRDDVGSESTTVATTRTTEPLATIAREENESSTLGRDNDDTNFLCESLFLHVPHFAIVPEEEQLAYVAGLLKNLTAVAHDT